MCISFNGDRCGLGEPEDSVNSGLSQLLFKQIVFTKAETTRDKLFCSAADFSKIRIAGIITRLTVEINNFHFQLSVDFIFLFQIEFQHPLLK